MHQEDQAVAVTTIQNAPSAKNTNVVCAAFALALWTAELRTTWVVCCCGIRTAMSLPPLCPVSQDRTFRDIVTAVGLSLGISVHSNEGTVCNWLAKGLSVAESFERSLHGAGLTPAVPLRYLIACLCPQVPTGSLIEYVERMLKLSIQGKWFFPVTAFDASVLSVTLDDVITAHLPDVAEHFSNINCSAAALLAPLLQRMFTGSLPIAVCCNLAQACLAGQGAVALTRAACSILTWHRSELLACQDMHAATKVLAPSGRGKQQQSIRAALPDMDLHRVAPFVGGPFQVHLTAAAAGVSPMLGAFSAEAVLGHAELGLHVRYLLHKNIVLSRLTRLPFGPPPLVRRGAPTVGAPTPTAARPTPTACNQLRVHVPSQHTLQLRSYHWVGFDLDHTLAQYNDALIAQHIVYAALSQLYSKYPAAATEIKQAAWRASTGSSSARVTSGAPQGTSAAGSTRPTSSSLASMASDVSAASSTLPECMQPQLPAPIVASMHKRYRASTAAEQVPSDAPRARARRGSMGGRGTGHRASDSASSSLGTAVDGGSGSKGVGFVLNSGPEPLWLHLCEAGVVLDRTLGNVLWVDANAHVKLGFHGNVALGHAELMALYPPAESSTCAGERCRSVSGTSAGSVTPGASFSASEQTSPTPYSSATDLVRARLPGIVPRLSPEHFPPSSTYSPANPTGGDRYIVAHTGFDSPLAGVFALLVAEADEWASSLSARPPLDYSYLFAAAAEAVRFTYTRFASQGFPAVLANATPFLHLGGLPPASPGGASTGRAAAGSTRRSMHSGRAAEADLLGNALPPAAYNKVPKAVKQAAGKALLSWLKDLRSSDVRRSVDGLPEAAAGQVRTFLLTNAAFEHARAVLSSLLGSEWQEAFDLVIVSARKKHMFESALAHATGSLASADLAPFKGVDKTSGRARALTKAALTTPAVESQVPTPPPPHGRLTRVASLSSPRQVAGRSSSLVSEGSDGGNSTGSDSTAVWGVEIRRRRRTISGERGLSGLSASSGGLSVGGAAPQASASAQTRAARIRSFDSQDSFSSAVGGAELGSGASPRPRPSPLSGAASQHWSPNLRRLSRADEFVPSNPSETFPGLGPPALSNAAVTGSAAVMPPTAPPPSSNWGGTAATSSGSGRTRLQRTHSMAARGGSVQPLNLSKGVIFAGGNVPQLLATMAKSSGVRQQAALRVLYVGDHANTDIVLAGQLGWHTLAVSKRLSFAMTAEAAHREHVAVAGAAASAAAASMAAPAASAANRRGSLSWMRPKQTAQPTSRTASDSGVSAGHPLLMTHMSRNAGSLSSGAQQDVRRRARTLDKRFDEAPEADSAISEALKQVGVSEPRLLGGGGASTQGGEAAAAPPQNNNVGTLQSNDRQLSGDARDSAVCDVMACRTWSSLPAYAWSESAAAFVTSFRGHAGRNVSRGRGLGQGQNAFWPLSVHSAATDVAATGPDSPFGFAGATPTWIEGVALSSQNCKGIIPSVLWLARALPCPSAKAQSSIRSTMLSPRKQLSGVQPSGRGVVEMHAHVRCDFGPAGADSLTPAAVRAGCGFPEELSFAFGMGAEPPPGLLRQAFTRCYAAVPPALQHSPFAVQVVQNEGGTKVLGPPRPPPTASEVLTAATSMPDAAMGVQIPWSGDMLLLHMRCSEAHLPWAFGLWRWHVAWATGLYPWPQSDWSSMLQAASTASMSGSKGVQAVSEEASALASEDDEAEGDPV